MLTRRRFLTSSTAASATSSEWYGASSSYATEHRKIGVPQVTWFDDFLGKELFPQYHVSANPGGFQGPAGPNDPHIGGWWRLWTDNRSDAAIQLRLGKDETADSYASLPFSAAKNVIGQTRFKMNMGASDLRVAIGFSGYKGPDNLISFQFNANDSKIWQLRLRSNASGVDIPLRWTHTPGIQYDLEIRTSSTRVEALIDGVVVAVGITNIPQAGMCWEYQVANKNNTSPAVWTDYLTIRQDR